MVGEHVENECPPLEGGPLAGVVLEDLLARLPPERGSGRMDLAQGWRLCWEPSTLVLIPTNPHG